MSSFSKNVRMQGCVILNPNMVNEECGFYNKKVLPMFQPPGGKFLFIVQLGCIKFVSYEDCRELGIRSTGITMIWIARTLQEIKHTFRFKFKLEFNTTRHLVLHSTLGRRIMLGIKNKSRKNFPQTLNIRVFRQLLVAPKNALKFKVKIR